MSNEIESRESGIDKGTIEKQGARYEKNSRGVWFTGGFGSGAGIIRGL
jgi:hypothetical protein